MRNQRKISNLVVHRMQREIGLLMVVVLMVTALCAGFLVHWTLEEAMREAGESLLPGSTIEILRVFKRLLLDRIFLSLTAGIFVIAFVVVNILHRVAGPLNRVSSTLRALGEGQIPKAISLRKKDYFVELAQDVNKVIQKVEELKESKPRGR